MNRVSLLFGVSLLAVRTLAGQTMSGNPAVDSAAVARRAYARGAALVRADSLDAAQREMTRAARAWPSQSAYHWGVAAVAAARRDTTLTLTALTGFAALGAAQPVRRDNRFAFMASDPRFVALAARFDTLSAPAAHSTVFATVSDSTLWPEGVDCSPEGDTCWMTSIAHRTVFVVTPGRGARPLLATDASLPGPVTAVRRDRDTGQLWVTTSSGIGPAPRGHQRAVLARVDAHTGNISQQVAIPGDDTLHVLGDLAVSSDGNVLVSDSRVPALYQLRKGQTSLETMTHPLFRSLQGVVFVPGTAYALVADYSHGLLRVDLETRAVVRLEDAPGSSSLGLDGIAWHDGSVIAVQNGSSPARVMQLRLDSSLARIAGVQELDRNLDVADEPTGGVIVGGAYVYVANSSWEKYGNEAGVRVPGTQLAAPVLLRLPLPVRP